MPDGVRGFGWRLPRPHHRAVLRGGRGESCGENAAGGSGVVRTAGRYAIHDAFASGGMASVHFGRFAGPGGFARTVAVKCPHGVTTADPESQTKLVAEARIASRIRHPNVVSTLDVVQSPEGVFLIMDYIHGETLAALMIAARERNERIPLPIAASIMIEVLRGLQAAHDARDERGAHLGIVLQDTSPQTILVGVDGVTRLIDFGVAKVDEGARGDGAPQWEGKSGYLAPEQVRGAAVTRQTDLFAASIIFWELLTGEPLFRAGGEVETLQRCLVGRIRRPSQLVSDISPELDAILERGLSRDPVRRYQTANEMARDVESCTPAVRASVVGAWVEALAGGTLAARSEVIAAIERQPLPDEEIDASAA